MSETKLKVQAMDSTTRLASKVITTTYNIATATGDVAYTGVGFVPTSIIAFFCIDGTVKEGRGFVDSAKGQECIYVDFDNNYYKRDSNLMFFVPASGNYVGGVLKTFDTDGFTITYTKTSSPTGTADITFLCFR